MGVKVQFPRGQSEDILDCFDNSKQSYLASKVEVMEGSNANPALFSSYAEEPAALRNERYSSLGFTPLTIGDILAVTTVIIRPQRIVEFGILQGFSLDIWLKRSPHACQVEAYDIFEDSSDGHMISRELEIRERFRGQKNLIIQKADFFRDSKRLLSEGIDADIVHVDVNNSGETVEFVMQNLWDKVRRGGVILMEGGSKARDELRPNSKSIHSALEAVAEREDIEITIIDAFPSITILRKI